MIGQIVSHYRILEKLGEGGMGVVYVAEDTRLRRRVAIKFSSATPDERGFYGRFLREARAISVLSHPHIATVYDYGETAEGQPFIVMELINGRNLGELLRDNALTLQRAVEIVEETAEALAEAHRHGIIHRDIKPTNVMVNSRGEVKVLDFGLAKQLEEERHLDADMEASTIMATHTRSDAVIGTLLYLSPEQATAAPVDARSDLFALGAMLYECIAGRPAFSGVNAIEVCAQILHVEPPPPSQFNGHIPPELDRITLKALAKRPADRYQSADQLIAELRTVRPTLCHATEQVVTQRIPPAPHTPRISALTSLSSALRQPRFSPFFFLVLVAVVALATWGAKRWMNRLHVPSEEALRVYQFGENALRDGTYHKASKALEEAIAIDSEYALAHARLAEAWAEMDYTDKAKDEILRVRALVPDYSALPELDGLRFQAITDTVERKFSPAIASYERIVLQSPNGEKPHAYVDLGRAYEKNENIDKAIESYLAAVNAEPRSAAALLRLGILHGRRQNVAGAQTVLKKAEDIYRSLSNYEGVTEALYQRGLLLSKLGRTAEARPHLQDALEITRTTTKSVYQQINTLRELSHVSLIAGDTKQAMEYARESLDMASDNRMENLSPSSLITLGNTLFAGAGDYGGAEDHYKKALDSARRFKGQRNEAAALFSLGNLRISRGNVDEGLRNVEQALDFYRNGDRSYAAKALLVIGRANRRKGRYDSAMNAFDEQLALAERVGDPSQVALAHNSIGTLLGDKENFAEALRHFDESYNIDKSLDATFNLDYDLLNRADMQWQLGRYPEAKSTLKQLEASMTQRAPNTIPKPVTAYAHLIHARMSLSERRFAEAKGRSKQSLAIAKETFKDVAAQAMYTLGLAQSLSGAKDEGHRSCENAVRLATGAGDPWLISNALLARAETRYEYGDMVGASADAVSAAESFARSGQRISEWRAWVIAAGAARTAGEEAKQHEYAARARALAENPQVTSFFERPDGRHYREITNVL
ncbi:MAG TPA: tetratricopeptide repeat protein [Pyrinomonadaceae bacterium]|nr:tetratricopeptide repeat protein [Pyrinomonadaceae bacterium]